MTLKDALVYFGVSGFVSKAALGRGSSLLPSTVFVFALGGDLSLPLIHRRIEMVAVCFCCISFGRFAAHPQAG